MKQEECNAISEDTCKGRLNNTGGHIYLCDKHLEQANELEQV